MSTFLQLLKRMGDALSLANIGNRSEFERLMRARLEDELALAKSDQRRAVPEPRPIESTPRAFSMATSVNAVQSVKESLA